jgi:phosphatidylglycerophosphate synthase
MKSPRLNLPESHTTVFEQWVISSLCRPASRRLTRRVHPNTITLINQCVSWSVFVALVIAPTVTSGFALTLRLAAIIGVWLSMFLDCLDGCHARETGQSSPLGEILDHGLDAINIPLVSAGVTITLSLDPFTSVVMVLLSAIIYYSQVLLYGRTGLFVSPPMPGTDAQAIVGATLLPISLMLYWAPTGAEWVLTCCLVYAWIAVLLQGRTLWYFLVYQGPFLKKGACFFISLSAIALLFCLTNVGEIATMLAITAVSFRFSASQVMYAVSRNKSSGRDLDMWALLAILLLGCVISEGLEGEVLDVWWFSGWVVVLGLTITVVLVHQFSTEYPRIKASSCPDK